MASHVGLCNNPTDLCDTAESIVDSALSYARALGCLFSCHLPSPASLLPPPAHLCFDRELSGSSRAAPASPESPRARVPPARAGNATAIPSCHRGRALARERAPCKCLQGSSTTLPLMLNKVLKSKALCKCCSYYQVGVLWFSSRELSCSRWLVLEAGPACLTFSFAGRRLS